MTSGASKLFEPCRVRYGDKDVAGVTATCRLCGQSARYPLNTVHGDHGGNEAKIDRMISRKFENDGWIIGKSSRHHRCPRCIKEPEYIKEKDMDKKVVDLKLPHADPPREMTFPDRRIINYKLMDVYGQNGYTNDWTDQGVATDLGVPVAWVRRVREDNYGPAGSNEEIDKIIKEAVLWQTEVAKISSDFIELDKRVKALAAQGELLERKVAQVQKKVGL